MLLFKSSANILTCHQFHQQQSRIRQEHQQQILRQMRQDLTPQNFHMMRGVNGAMNINMGMKPGTNQLQRTAMANSQNK
jgi:hypothetical protein